MDYTNSLLALGLVLLAFALGIVWLFFPFLLFDRLRKQRKLLEEIRDNTQTIAYFAQKEDRRADHEAGFTGGQ